MVDLHAGYNDFVLTIQMNAANLASELHYEIKTNSTASAKKNYVTAFYVDEEDTIDTMNFESNSITILESTNRLGFGRISTLCTLYLSRKDNAFYFRGSLTDYQNFATVQGRHNSDVTTISVHQKIFRRS